MDGNNVPLPIMEIIVLSPATGAEALPHQRGVDRLRQDQIAVATIEWKMGREVVLARLEEMLDRAAEATDEAYRANLYAAGPKGRPP
jgi:hypothetical protein